MTGVNIMLKKLIFSLLIIFILINAVPVYCGAIRGDCGYEGGISSGTLDKESALMEYQEVCFISGTPLVFKGTLNIKVSSRQEKIRKIHTYNLSNVKKDATLRRTVVYDTRKVQKENGQVIEETVLASNPSEVIKIGTKVYTLKNYDFTLSGIIDKKYAIDYFAGNFWGKKTYQAGNLKNDGTVTLEANGNFYGYDQYWGTTETGIINYVILSEEKKENDVVDRWGGTADITFSSSTTKQLKYIKNKPEQISFGGGYVQVNDSNSILEFDLLLPKFDYEGVSTDNITNIKETLKLESSPVQKRLPVPDLKHLRGHWSENDVKSLYSLEILQGKSSEFNPLQLMTRKEFISSVVKATKKPKQDSISKSAPLFSRLVRTKQEVIKSPFIDVSLDNPYFEYINTAFEQGLINGKGHNMFAPDDYITVADAITIFIRALGLERLAPNPGAVTVFKDNDEIPGYARNAVFAAHKIGLVKGDERGCIRAEEYITKDRAAALINRFINYMRTGIRKDYRERIIDY